jgi:hypothetical protein
MQFWKKNLVYKKSSEQKNTQYNIRNARLYMLLLR